MSKRYGRQIHKILKKIRVILLAFCMAAALASGQSFTFGGEHGFVFDGGFAFASSPGFALTGDPSFSPISGQSSVLAGGRGFALAGSFDGMFRVDSDRLYGAMTSTADADGRIELESGGTAYIPWVFQGENMSVTDDFIKITLEFDNSASALVNELKYEIKASRTSARQNADKKAFLMEWRPDIKAGAVGTADVKVLIKANVRDSNGNVKSVEEQETLHVIFKRPGGATPPGPGGPSESETKAPDGEPNGKPDNESDSDQTEDSGGSGQEDTGNGNGGAGGTDKPGGEGISGTGGGGEGNGGTDKPGGESDDETNESGEPGDGSGHGSDNGAGEGGDNGDISDGSGGGGNGDVSGGDNGAGGDGNGGGGNGDDSDGGSDDNSGGNDGGGGSDGPVTWTDSGAGGGMGGSGGSGEEAPDPAAKIRLINCTVDKEEIHPGHQVTVTATLKNSSAVSAIKDLRIVYESESGEVLPASPVNSIYVDAIGAGNTCDISFVLDIGYNLTSDSQKLTLAFEYTDKSAAALASAETIFLKITPSFDFKVDQPSMAASAAVYTTQDITVNVYNTGQSTVKNVICTLEMPGVTAAGSAFGGDVAAGESKTITLKTLIGKLDNENEQKAYGRTTGVIHVQYEDESGKSYSQDVTVMTQITLPEGETEQEEIPRSSQWWISIVCGLVAVQAAAFIIIGVHRRRNV